MTTRTLSSSHPARTTTSGNFFVTRPLTLRKDPAADGDAVITGELLIQIRSREVKVEDLTFRNLEIGKFTDSSGRGESDRQSAPSNLNGSGRSLPVRT